MIYLDTSVLVPLVVLETTSAKARVWRDQLSPKESAELALSVWTLTEFTSAMGIKVRNRKLSRKQAESALRLLNEDVVPSVKLLEVTPTEFRLAETMLREFAKGLRAGDALHLAIAARSEVRVFATLDGKLLSVAKAFGLPTAVI